MKQSAIRIDLAKAMQRATVSAFPRMRCAYPGYFRATSTAWVTPQTPHPTPNQPAINRAAQTGEMMTTANRPCA